MFKGAYVAIITPFKHGVIDLEALHHLVEWHVDQGTQGLVACGCTGEGLCLNPEEQKAVLETVMQAAKKQIPVIGSVSSITTAATLQLAQQAEAIGVDGLMVMTPPALKLTQSALYEYFKYIHDHVQTPMIIYDNPTRTGTSIHNETVIKFAQLKHIVALKDSSGDILHLTDLIPELPADFTVLSGDDFTTGGAYAYGIHGAISVTGNIAPKLMAEYWQTWQQGNITRFLELGRILAPLNKAAFCEGNPTSVKYGASLLGLCHGEVRPPLQSISPTAAQQVENAMKWAGLLDIKKISHG